MASILPDYEYDIFISYRQNDNRNEWVTEFVSALQVELAATIKEPLSIYFDKNPHDGLLETHSVDKSLEGKLKCLLFIPIISQTYCDPKSFAWQHEFCAFNELSKADQFGRDITLSNGNVTSRILPIKIHDLDAEDQSTVESEIGGVLRSIEFIYREAGVSRPLKSTDDRSLNLENTDYQNQVNKVARAVKEIISAIKSPGPKSKQAKLSHHQPTGKSKKAMAIIYVFVVVLIAVAGYFIYPKISSSGTSETSAADSIVDKSIAVLPFDNFMEAEGLRYFADGLTEEILNVLAKAPDLKVASRTSSFQYKDRKEDIRKIASELGVAHILEGSVRGSGDRLRITAQLIRASDGFHLWSETYDKTQDDIIQIQEDIALKIAQALNTAMNPVALQEMIRSGTTSVEAYSNYLKGMALPSGIESLEYFEKALSIDSTFALAHFRSASFWHDQLLITRHGSSSTGKNYTEKVKLFNERITRAIECAPPVDKLKYQGYRASVQLEFRKALTYTQDYLKQRPNDIDARGMMISLTVYLGEWDDAKAHIHAHTENSLSNADSYSSIINRYFQARLYKEGSTFAKKALEEFPNDEDVLYQAHRIFLWNGSVKDAKRTHDRYVLLDPNSELAPTLRMRQASANGDSALASSIYFNEIKTQPHSYFSKWMGLILLNRQQEALEILKPIEDRGELYSLSSWLHYAYFDEAQFPKLKAILDREGAKPRPHFPIPFALKK